MTDHPEYTLSRPPSCPRNQDHLRFRVQAAIPAVSTTWGSTFLDRCVIRSTPNLRDVDCRARPP